MFLCIVLCHRGWGRQVDGKERLLFIGVHRPFVSYISIQSTPTNPPTHPSIHPHKQNRSEPGPAHTKKIGTAPSAPSLSAAPQPAAAAAPTAEGAEGIAHLDFAELHVPIKCVWGVGGVGWSKSLMLCILCVVCVPTRRPTQSINPPPTLTNTKIIKTHRVREESERPPPPTAAEEGRRLARLEEVNACVCACACV